MAHDVTMRPSSCRSVSTDIAQVRLTAMSGIVRILAIVLGIAAAAMLYFAWHFPWYLASIAAVAVLVLFPITHEFVAGLRRDVRLKHLLRHERERHDASENSNRDTTRR